jgi:uncharacterized iron-regulated protein
LFIIQGMANPLILGPRARLGIQLLVLTLAGPSAAADTLATPVVDLHALPALQQILPGLAERQVVFVGEAHDEYSHHQVQLAIIRALHARHPDLVIGMEQFQQPFQPALDAWIAGEIDEPTLLRKTEYLDRWRFDWRLYRPILAYAREQKIPVIALNVPGELTTKVAAAGIDGLSAEEKARLPEIDGKDDKYVARIRSVYDAHPAHAGGSFDHFLEAQLLWDEGMADRAADYLKANPARPMVILAGEGHVAWRDGIPNRLARRVPLSSAVVVNGPQEELGPALADYVLLPAPETLPPRGMLGVSMGAADKGVLVSGFAAGSAALAAGVEKEDRIVELDGHPVSNPTDVTLLMLDRKPGDAVDLAVSRRSWVGADKLLRYRVVLR